MSAMSVSMRISTASRCNCDPLRKRYSTVAPCCFSAAVKAGYIWLAVIGVLMSAVSAYFYLRVLVVMYMKEPEAGAEYAARPWAPIVSAGVTVSLWVCALYMLVLGIWPGWLNHFAHQAVQGLWRLL